MAKCASCGATIVFGGSKQAGLRFCNDQCLANGVAAQTAMELPPEFIEAKLIEMHRGDCPNCGGPGPVDVHSSQRIASFLVMTTWSDRIGVGCAGCGRKQRIADVFYCLTLGWWGFPWGLLGTPIQILRNLTGMISPIKPGAPSAELRQLVTLDLAARLAEEDAQQQAESQPPFPSAGG